MRIAERRGLPALLALALACTGAPAHAAIAIQIVNADGAGEGFNDQTPVAPVGGNNGTTLGAQRLVVFQRAADQWAALLGGNAVIVVEARFNPQTCTATSATLGSAGPIGVQANFAQAPRTNVWYHDALANALRGVDFTPGDPEIVATFNSNIDSGCLGSTAGWWYGVDPAVAAAPDRLPLLPVVFHELAHGLGFSSLVDESTGQRFSGRIDIYSTFIRDLSSGLTWEAMNDAQRVVSAINDPNLTWNGPNVTAQQAVFLRSPARLAVLSPPGIAGNYAAQTASYGPAPASAGLTGQIVAATDAAAPTTDGCTAFTNAAQVAGRIALVDRGNCNFTVKSRNAQNAGAIGVLVANNVAPGLPPMGGSDTTITIPSYGISQADGQLIRNNLGAGVNATMGYDNTQPLAGTNGGFVRLYAPNPVEPGSSISHFTTDAEPSLLMEPAISSNLFDQVDLTLPAFQDIGWQLSGGGPPPNQAPSVSQPVSNQLGVVEDVASSLAGIAFADPDAGTGTLTATFSIPQGAIAGFLVPGIVIAGTPTARTLTGTLSALNSYIAGNNLTYTTAQDSTLAQTLAITINDNGNTGAGGPQTGTRNVTLGVSAVNDAPSVNAPPGYTVGEDVVTALGGITVADIDAGANQLQLTATATAGTFGLTGGGVNVTGSGTSAVTITGGIGAINTWLAGNNLRYRTAQDATAGATVNFSVNDFGAIGSGGALTGNDSATISVTAANDAPIVSGPASIAATVAGQTPVTGVSVADVDAAGGNVAITWAVSAGTMSATAGGGVTVSGSGTNAMTTAGSLANLNAYVAAGSVRFDAPGGSADVTLTVTANDNGNTGSGGAQSGSRQITLVLSLIFKDSIEDP